MSATITTFLFEMANFLVLAGVLGWMFFKPIRQALIDYRTKFEADNERAAQKLAEAEEAMREIEDKRSGLQADLAEQRSRELEEAHRQAEQIVAGAQAAAQREQERSQRQAASMLNSQRDALAEASAAAAADLVMRLLDQISGPQLQQALVESACRQLDAFPAQQLAPITVESSSRLTEEQIAHVRRALGESASEADFRSVDGLGAGVRITTSQGLIDASVSGLSRFARQSLVKEMNRRGNHPQPLQDARNA